MRAEFKTIDDRLDALAYATPGSAAVDLRACMIESNGEFVSLDASIVLLPGEKMKIGAGVAIHIGSILLEDDDLQDDMPMLPAGLMIPRSGLGSRGLRLSNTAGLIDSDYCKQIIMAVENAGNDAIVINPLDRIAQFLVVPVLRPAYVSVDEFSNGTKRGGFGSTGIA